MSKIYFNVDAYTAKLIGRENVSNLDGAVLELVKNTYDADASICFIYYEETTDTLYIGDNGAGMTENIIKKHWMTIGSSSKRINFKTNKGRVQTGAKGIGRFALDRIGDSCTLLTASESERLFWQVDWSVFEFGNNITDITAELDKTDMGFAEFIGAIENKEVVSLIKQFFKDTGSVFKITNLRDEWNNAAVTSVKTNLKTLIPPEFAHIFNIYFFEIKTTIEEAALLQDDAVFSYDYKIEFEAFPNGSVRVSINRAEFDFGENLNKIADEAGFDETQKAYFRGSLICIDTSFSDILKSKIPVENTIGDFNGVLYFAKIHVSPIDKEKYFYKDITGRPDIRESFGGIRIYRDGFRVRPYGDPKSSSADWLMLSSRKNKSPAAISHPTGAWRVNSDQIHGSIYISRTNITLPDQANRQGIVETKEFSVLKEFMKNIIGLFEQDRQFVGRKLNAYYDKLHPVEEIKTEIETKIKNDLKNQEESKKTAAVYKPEQIEVKRVSVLVEQKEAEIKQLETEIQMLSVLATTGIVTNTYIHEIKSITHKLGMKILMAKEAIELDNDPNNALKYIIEANEMRNFFTSWFKVTIESVRRDKRQLKKININELLHSLVSGWEVALSPKNIKLIYSAEDIVFRCFPYEIESIINNLISNSATSFDNLREGEKEINMSIEQIDKSIVINYKDSGKGLSPVYKNNPRQILDPFESDKRIAGGEIIGTGMGMWIINRIVSDYNGSIDLSENVKHDTGFYITIRLNGK